MAERQPPEDILEAVKVIRTLKEKRNQTREEKVVLNRAKLRIAYWVCGNENIPPTRENLAYVLGNDADDIMKAYDKYLEVADKSSAASRKNKPGRNTDSRFWGG